MMLVPLLSSSHIKPNLRICPLYKYGSLGEDSPELFFRYLA